jgi:hypothetical protein
MNMAEILRKLADVVDGKETGAGTEITNRPGADSEMQSAPEPETGENVEVINVEPMVPPLQQKLELLKKIAGEEVCSDCGHDPCKCGHEDELQILKRNAGMPTMSPMPSLLAHITDEDEPFEG